MAAPSGALLAASLMVAGAALAKLDLVVMRSPTGGFFFAEGGGSHKRRVRNVPTDFASNMTEYVLRGHGMGGALEMGWYVPGGEYLHVGLELPDGQLRHAASSVWLAAHITIDLTARIMTA